MSSIYSSQHNPMKIVVISTKGGVGKSTIAMQLVAPYLYENNLKKAINYVECDDTNRDINSYGATSIIKRSIVNISSPLLREELFNICSLNEPVCIDVGGNNTAKTIIDALDESGSLPQIDIVLIPTLDGEQDMINAIDTYNYIKKLNSDTKFIFVLNRVKEPSYVVEQFDHFFGDSRGVFNNFYAAKNYINDEEKSLFISFTDDDVVKFSRRFGLTVYEIAQMENEHLKNILESSNPKVASFKHFMSRSSEKYYQNVLTQGFHIIDEKISLSKEIG